MRRNIFWTAWGIVGLSFFLAASIKSFATEIRKRAEDRKHTYVAEEKPVSSATKAGH
ncbi:MAG: hypothetical protein PHD82_06650 [Candidatus Riflebacteria bacterium]|jgi:hypothetical protein|nr:hypothetical protein [Candidatus Riflebacteria bacterium]